MIKNFNFQQLFCQLFLNNQCISDEELDCWIDRIKSKHSNNQRQSNVVQMQMEKELAIMNGNKIFRDYGFFIRKINNLDKWYYVLTNDNENVLIESKTTWTLNENRLYYLLIDSIMEKFLNFDEDDDNEFDIKKHLSIGKTFANNLAKTTNLTIIKTEKIIDNWINQYWFSRIDNNSKITFGPRTLAQKNTYLINKYGLSSCKICCFICFYNYYKCNECNNFIHQTCLTNDSSVCSSCGSSSMVQF